MKKSIAAFLCMALCISSAASVMASETPSPSETIVPTEAVQTQAPSESPQATITPDISVDQASDSTAEPSQTVSEETPAPSGPVSNQVVVRLTFEQQPYTIDSFAHLQLYSDDGELLSEGTQWVGGITTELVYTFSVPEYTAGETFSLKMDSGLSALRYYNDLYYAGQSIDLTTYTTETDGVQTVSDKFELNAVPVFNKSVNLKYDGVPVGLYPGARVIDGVTMVPIRALAQYIGLNVEYNSSYNVEIVSLGNDKIYFNLDTDYTTVFGTDIAAQHPTIMLDGTVFVALRTFADALGSSLDVKDNYTSLDINMTASSRVNNYFNGMFVNQSGISSRTDYLVWISLHEYKARVYLGKQYQWKPIREMTCAIGAPSSPTITGSFEYQYSMPRWDYGTYYVGPCLVFYGNYALHSVFLYQDGSEYDGRVGMQLSHGCVRFKKVDIDWLYSMIPLKTRIYITP